MVPVKLPKEVLSLFPTWEYHCPCCGTYVESNISFCPNCKTPFDENKWRVPPRFLKSHDAMSEYAHKVLAPKLTQKQRELLFRYFTELFSDGFESGDFSAWTGTNGSPSIVGSPVHCGSYAAYFNSAYENCYITYSGETTVHSRVYVRIPTSLQTDPNTTEFMKHQGTAGIAGVGVCSSYWRLSYYSGGWQTATWADTPSADTWYCVELKSVIDSSNGEHRVWIDGTERITVTGIQTNEHGSSVTDTYVGETAWNSREMYIDCVVVADTYIGPESMEQTYTKTWTADSLFKKLGITKPFNVDAAFQKSFITQKQIDALFKRLDAAKTFGLDAYFGPAEAETYMKNFALDAIFAYKVRLPELWLDENGKLVLNISKPYTWAGT